MYLITYNSYYGGGQIMKALKFLSAILVLFLSVSGFAENPDQAEESAVKQAITNYFSGIDSRNPEIVGHSLDSDATVLSINNISNKTSRLSADDVIIQVKKGTLGGWKRAVKFDNLDFNGKTAMAKVELSDAKVIQTGYVSLVNDNGEWKIVSDVSIINKIE